MVRVGRWRAELFAEYARGRFGVGMVREECISIPVCCSERSTHWRYGQPLPWRGEQSRGPLLQEGSRNA